MENFLGKAVSSIETKLSQPWPEQQPQVFSVLGVSVNAVQIPDVIERMEKWIRQKNGCHYITVTGMHGVTEAQHDPSFKQILNSAGMVVPDGYPLVLLGRKNGFRHLARRVYGPELMATFCEQTSRLGYRHFFYGGAPGVAEDLAQKFTQQYPGLVVAGTYSPPFRDVTPEEDQETIARVEECRTDVLWVGLGTPKQELWMYEHRDKLSVPVLVGVGAAFDFHTGRTKQAPKWMREHGLEWLFRLCAEPRRLWRRYILYGTEFVWLVALELFGFRKFR
jgi:N-acetylglucosaminyldiphosphoundecaprenol N-acetyl-beta-D-mannosaminyltransferase